MIKVLARARIRKCLRLYSTSIPDAPGDFGKEKVPRKLSKSILRDQIPAIPNKLEFLVKNAPNVDKEYSEKQRQTYFERVKDISIMMDRIVQSNNSTPKEVELKYPVSESSIEEIIGIINSLSSNEYHQYLSQNSAERRDLLSPGSLAVCFPDKRSTPMLENLICHISSKLGFNHLALNGRAYTSLWGTLARLTSSLKEDSEVDHFDVVFCHANNNHPNKDKSNHELFLQVIAEYLNNGKPTVITIPEFDTILNDNEFDEDILNTVIEEWNRKSDSKILLVGLEHETPSFTQLIVDVELKQHDVEKLESQLCKDKRISIFLQNFEEAHAWYHPLRSSASPEKAKCFPIFSEELLDGEDISKLCALNNNLWDKQTAAALDFDGSLGPFEKYYNKPHKQSNSKKTEIPRIEDLNKHESALYRCIQKAEDLSTDFSDIGALDSVIARLNKLVMLPLMRPDLFSKGLLKQNTSGVLLFGPPGTGKTLLARAIAAKCGANFLYVKLSDLLDMYVGESEKMVVALFSLAKKISPCIVFVDEIDSLLAARQKSSSSNVKNDVTNAFMSEWDGLSTNNNRLTVLGATNRPFALDDAVLRRMPQRILIDLPDVAARQSILKVLLKEESLDGISIQELAKRTEMFSGSDLKNLCYSAALESAQDIANSNDHSSERVIKPSHFESAFLTSSPSMSEDMSSLRELREWNKKFGGNHATYKQQKLGF